ncbi:MAG: response regulator transcription factor [Anaerolineae bacterium]|nr:response regulator transcription factor [Anaerolineae bacterium]
MPEKILVIDDDPLLLTLIQQSLQKDNYSIKTAPNGPEGLEVMEKFKPDLVILDIMMPGVSGWEICDEIRRTSTVPIIMLTARGSQTDIVRGLQSGADDYLVKPFHQAELLARVSAVLRRVRTTPASATERMNFGEGELVIDPADHRVTRHDEEIELTPTEFNLLIFMANRAGRILSTEVIFDNVWSYDTEANLESVKWYVWRLRKKIEENPSRPKFIITERGVGYRFAPGLNQTDGG